MRLARRNIGERSENPSSLPAAGRPENWMGMETAGKGSTEAPFRSVQALSHSRWRHIGTHIVRLVAFGVRPAMGWSIPCSLGEFLVEGPRLGRKEPLSRHERPSSE